MNVRKLMVVAIGLLLAGLFMNATATAQVSRERSEAIRARMKQLKDFFYNMPDEHKRALSGSAQNLMHLAESPDRMEELMREGTARPRLPSAPSGEASEDEYKLTRVSDPGNDFAFSVLTGFTQNEN